MQQTVKKVFEAYPVEICEILMQVRSFILAVCEEENLGEVTETLKWGEPSYTVSGGSVVRFDWKAKSPDQFAVYFNCQTVLIETFKEIYGELFNYEGNRAIIFQLDTEIPETALKHCIALSLQYKKLKNLPLLGA